jgi:hypothetical protein
VARELRDPAGAVQTAADYSRLGDLLLAVLVIGFAAPFLAIAFARLSRFRSA